MGFKYRVGDCVIFLAKISGSLKKIGKINEAYADNGLKFYEIDFMYRVREFQIEGRT